MSKKKIKGQRSLVHKQLHMISSSYNTFTEQRFQSPTHTHNHHIKIKISNKVKRKACNKVVIIMNSHWKTLKAKQKKKTGSVLKNHHVIKHKTN
jgi:Fe2+ or Zn2+ uptake regulation protein